MGEGTVSHDGQERAARPRALTGGYFWVPIPADPTISWDVVTCHQLGFDSETGHVEMWGAVLDRLALTWHMNDNVLRRSLRDCCYGLPRGRVTRPERRFLILHGDDSPRPDWQERVLTAFHLDRPSVRVLYDEHERTMKEDRCRVSEALHISAF